MALTASVTLVVPALPENEIWFANAQAWTNYWRLVTGSITIEPISVMRYATTEYDNDLTPLGLNINGTTYDLPTVDMFQSLLNKLDTLETSYRQLRAELVSAELIEEE